MRILHIIRTVDPQAGGPAESVRTLMSYSDLGYQGEVVTADDPNDAFLKKLPFRVHALGPASVYGYTARLIPWLEENYFRFDGVIVNGLWNFGGFAAWRTLKGRIPYMLFPHGMLDPYFKRAYPLKHLKKLAYWLPVEYWVLRNAYRVLFTSTSEKELAEQTFTIHRWTPHVVPYGADSPQLAPEVYKKAFYDQCPSLEGKRFLLFLGRIHPKKGCDLLIDAFVQTASKDPGLHLVMAGPDQVGWRADLEKKLAPTGLQDRVHWPGMLRGDLKWGVFYACEAFILPSHQENFGIAVAEALACAKPVLLSDQVNIAPQIGEDGAGFVEPDTAVGTLNLLNRWLAAPQQERSRMAAQALTTFRLRYDMRENAKTIIRLFTQALGEQSSTRAAS